MIISLMFTVIIVFVLIRNIGFTIIATERAWTHATRKTGPRTGHEGPGGESMGGGGVGPKLLSAALPLGKTGCTHCIGGWVGRCRQVQKILPLPGFLFCILLYSVCTSSVLGSLSWLYCILPFCLYLKRTPRTSMPPGGIRYCKTSKRSAAVTRFRPIGHLDRLLDHRTVHSIASRYTDWAIPDNARHT
jgi:hypothetical protein